MLNSPTLLRADLHKGRHGPRILLKNCAKLHSTFPVLKNCAKLHSTSVESEAEQPLRRACRICSYIGNILAPSAILQHTIIQVMCLLEMLVYTFHIKVMQHQLRKELCNSRYVWSHSSEWNVTVAISLEQQCDTRSRHMMIKGLKSPFGAHTYSGASHSGGENAHRS